ncbi:spermidine synthase [Paucibacter sp. DJ2R-2]|uniref:spermidine synthase n=1 Tax=Paucibacter sp. DJ2R-2 TaxID=2893558 RepID=UPI0021E50482|nr:spermidine synthase [Paucibacter sp. DJ2R-2]MCV2421399.1 spermidine synthase [Paucibacter sp. DJ4R-1]MCV2438081.1 spermidine synthase [Paucibacter sp. DJ2R-2]
MSLSNKSKTNSKSKTGAMPWAPATMSEFDGVRFLHLDSIWVQGAMRIRKPQHLELEYIQRMMAWMLWRPSAELRSGHALQLGLGAGAITRFCHKVLRMKTTAVELNPTVIQACRMWFHLPEDDKRLTVINEDAGQWVANPEHLQTVDVLNIDLYDHEAAGPVLDDEDFYRHCHGLLVDGGLMTVNLFGRDASFAASARRVAAIFGSDQVWSLTPTKEGNTVLVAARGVVVPDREELECRAANIESLFELPARKWLRMVRPLPLSILNPQ